MSWFRNNKGLRSFSWGRNGPRPRDHVYSESRKVHYPAQIDHDINWHLLYSMLAPCRVRITIPPPNLGAYPAYLTKMFIFLYMSRDEVPN
jgi:hypothetical protein